MNGIVLIHGAYDTICIPASKIKTIIRRTPKDECYYASAYQIILDDGTSFSIGQNSHKDDFDNLRYENDNAYESLLLMLESDSNTNKCEFTDLI